MTLSGKTVAILVEADYQDLEVWYPLLRLKEEGATVLVVGTGSSPSYKGKYGYPIQVQVVASQVDADRLDGIIIPGGWAPDRLRQHEPVLSLVRHLAGREKVIACICHGGWVLASANVVRGRTLTAYQAIRDDLVNAGAIFVDEECVRDGNFVTSRKPDDLPAFMRATVAALAGR